MTIMRNYKMFVYRVSFTYRTPVRDKLGETTGEMRNVQEDITFKIVAPNRILADAWVQQHYNAQHLNHRDFTCELMREEEAPYILMEIPF